MWFCTKSYICRQSHKLCQIFYYLQGGSRSSVSTDMLWTRPEHLYWVMLDHPTNETMSIWAHWQYLTMPVGNKSAHRHATIAYFRPLLEWVGHSIQQHKNHQKPKPAGQLQRLIFNRSRKIHLPNFLRLLACYYWIAVPIQRIHHLPFDTKINGCWCYK